MDWEAASFEHKVFWLVLLEECMSAKLQSRANVTQQSLRARAATATIQCKTTEQLATRVEHMAKKRLETAVSLSA